LDLYRPQLTVLAFFKYFNFFEDNLVALLSTNWLKIGGLDCPHLVTKSELAFTLFTPLLLAVDTYRGK